MVDDESETVFLAYQGMDICKLTAVVIIHTKTQAKLNPRRGR